MPPLTSRGSARYFLFVLPLVLLLLLYHPALQAWFVDDDFAWLTLLSRIHGFRDFLHAMFVPMAQGTIRPWSDRGYFLLLQFLFGPESLPFHLTTMITALADAWMLAWVAHRMTGSRFAALFAPLLWLANAALVLPMGWSSAYDQIQCCAFLLGALSLYIRYLETGNRRLWWCQLAVFVLGFGSLEINVVYPVIAAAWLVFVSRAASRKVFARDIAPLAAISLSYFILHQSATPVPRTGPYAPHFDTSTLRSLGLYLRWSVVPEPFERFGYSGTTAIAVLVIVAVFLVAFAGFELHKRQTGFLFGGSWYLATLLPVLPLAEHRSDYYLALPTIGLALTGAQAIGRAWEARGSARVFAWIPVCLYLYVNIPIVRAETQWWTDRSLEARTLVLGTAAARKTHPNTTIVLDGVSSDLFNTTLRHRALIPFAVENVYLSPKSAAGVHPEPPANITAVRLDAGSLLHGLSEGKVVVYSISGDHLRNITSDYSRNAASRLPDREPARIDLGNPLSSWLLGAGWSPPDIDSRWTAARATLRLRVPAEGGSQIVLDGYCPPEELAQGPRHLTVMIDGVVAAETDIRGPESEFHRELSVTSLPPGRPVELDLRISPVFRHDGKELGLVFNTISIQR